MNITFRQLQVFEAVARRLSYTQASRELHLSQPAVSMQIKQLEEALGVELFEQIGKKIFLTDVGDDMYHYSRVIARQLGEMKEIVDEIKGIRRGHLNISVASTANAFATRLLAQFAKRFSGTTFSLDVTNRATLLQQLNDNEKDLVIMGQPPKDLNLTTAGFLNNPLVIIAPPDHPLAGEANIPMQQLADETFVVREAGSGTFIAMENFFKAQGTQLKTGMEMTTNEAIKQAVQARLGLGIVSIHTLELELAANRLVILDVANFPILRHWYIVHREDKRLSPVATAFRLFVLNEAETLLTSE